MSKKKKKRSSSQKMNKQRTEQRPEQRPGNQVRLSQCMIVKNEEKHIERALEWAKDIAFEQIVVDTGSTDRTVELAKKMGATVYHFEWINDFAAAKNFAMDKAKGDWIAILDADEYLSKSDAKELGKLLKKIQDDPVTSKECDAVTTTFVNLDDNGNIISIISHQRVFRNRPDLRFVGKIHEVIELKNKHFQAPEIRIIHTGYTQENYADANKFERNVKMLKDELEKDPDNPDIMLYYADSVKLTGSEEALAEAEEMFHKALNSNKPTNKLIKQLAYNYLIPLYLKDEAKYDEAMRLCDEATTELPNFIDYFYFRAVLKNKIGNYKAAQEDLEVCEKAFMNSASIPTTKILMPSPLLLFYQLLKSAEGQNDEEGIAKNSTFINTMLTEGKDQPGIVGSYIRAVLEDGASEEVVLDKLSELYDMSDPKNILFIARAAKDSGAAEFTRNVMKIAKEMLDENAPVRISQCMIVKNEEKNIEQALSWAKEIAYEQIVIDTGSTDRTVEIAEKMGAKIYHFEWIDDFSAAKNYAMDKAKGNWIAILDADEFMSPEDAKKIKDLTEKIQSDPNLLKKYASITNTLINLDDNGNANSIITQRRFFQNRPDLRFTGKIHEAVRTNDESYIAEDIQIMHTGYSETSFKEKDKLERNTRILRQEHKQNPDDTDITLYLADSIKAASTEEAREEAEALYLKGLNSKTQADPAIKRIAYDFLIPRFINNKDKNNEAEKLCEEAIKLLPDNIDYIYYRAVIHNNKGEYDKAMEDLRKCENVLMTSATLPETRVLMPSPILLFYQLLTASKGLNDDYNIIQYTAVVDAMLTEGKNQPEVLGPYLAALFSRGLTGIEVFENLAPVYNTNDKNDLRLIANAAKKYGITLFAEKIMEMIGEEV